MAEKKEASIYPETMPESPQGLKPVSGSCEIFLDSLGQLYSLEFDCVSGYRKLIKHAVYLK